MGGQGAMGELGGLGAMGELGVMGELGERMTVGNVCLREVKSIEIGIVFLL